ncbi:MAG: hypothetical protein R3A80_02610 [Bdellovibrionota bacterium]
MKKFIQSTLLFLFVLTASAQTIPFVHEFDLKDYKGQTYLSFMEKTVKPALDELAVNGYQMKGPAAVEEAYNLSDRKVQRKVGQWGGLEHVKEIAAQLEGETVTLNNLPQKIRAIDRSVNAYDLSTFLGLASGGGVSIKFYDQNYALNVHYDVEEQRSGRSFGVSNERRANDASDKDYLKDLQKYTRGAPHNLEQFNKALLSSILNNDPSNYPEVHKLGQAVLTDFLAVFTAEQDRNLMDGRVTPHWDAALLEVTLLANFHAGQEEIKLFYQNPETRETTFTNKTLKQAPCEVPTRTQTATLQDYWQFSRNIQSAENCRRSGINVTKREFRLLGKKITQYTKDNNPEIMNSLKSSMNLTRSPSNMFEELSKYLINSRAPRELRTNKVEDITNAWVNFLNYVQKEAPAISLAIEEGTL